MAVFVVDTKYRQLTGNDVFLFLDPSIFSNQRAHNNAYFPRTVSALQLLDPAVAMSFKVAILGKLLIRMRQHYMRFHWLSHRSYLQGIKGTVETILAGRITTAFRCLISPWTRYAAYCRIQTLPRVKANSGNATFYISPHAASIIYPIDES